MFVLNGVIGDGEWTCPHLGASRKVSFVVHRSAAGVFRAKVFGARFPTGSWGGAADRIAAGANSMRLDVDVGLPGLQDQQRDNDTLCLLSNGHGMTYGFPRGAGHLKRRPDLR